MSGVRVRSTIAVAVMVSIVVLVGCRAAAPSAEPAGTLALTAPSSGALASPTVLSTVAPSAAPTTGQTSRPALGALVSRPALNAGRDTSCINDGRGNTAPTATPPPSVLAGVICATVSVDGYQREFLVYLPERVLSPAPLVFMFHGSGGTGPQFLRSSGWREQADTAGLVAIFPTGLEYLVLDEGRTSTKWNDFSLAAEVDLVRKPRGYPAAAPWPADDVTFTRMMIDAVRKVLPVDEQRIFISGFSNGSGMVTRLAVEASDVIDAATGNFNLLQKVATPLARIPRFVTVGNEDDRLMAVLGATRPLPLSIEQLRAFPLMGAGFRNELATWLLEDPPVSATRSGLGFARWATRSPGNTAGNVFHYAILQGMGHAYPNGRNNDANFVAAKEFWNFFLDPSAN